jgi:hypothetical protein
LLRSARLFGPRAFRNFDFVGAIAGYLKDGRFPDRAVLAKEAFEAATAEMTTGTVGRAQTLKGWFVLVKDKRQCLRSGFARTAAGNKIPGRRAA